MIKINSKRNKGITLVALVITIIILLILAGITINSLTGSGLFDKVRLAKQKSENAERLENETLGEYEKEIEGHLDGTRENNIGTWKKWISGTGYSSEANAITLPETYSEILIEVGEGSTSKYCYTFYFCKEMLSDETYKLYATGYGADGGTTGAQVFVKKDKLYLREFGHMRKLL